MPDNKTIESYKGYSLKIETTRWYSEEYYVLTPDSRRTAGLNFDSKEQAIRIFKKYVDEGRVFDLPLDY